MMPRSMAGQIRRYFRERSDAQFAAGQRRFFGPDVEAFGVRGGAVNELARQVYAEVKRWPEEQRRELMERLWQMGRLESGALVCHVERRFGRGFGRREFAVLERWLDQYANNWAHTDGIASWLVAACIANDPTLHLWPWTDSPSRWKRRASAVSLLQEAKQGRSTGFLLRVSKKLLADPDDMVQKGVGWLLKETYPRKPEETVAFLLRQRHAASRLALRYAAGKMTAEDKRRVLE